MYELQDASEEDIYFQQDINTDRIITSVPVNEKKPELGYKYLHRLNSNMHNFTDKAYQHASMEAFVNRTGVVIYLKRTDNTIIAIPPESNSRRIPTYDYFASPGVASPFTFRAMQSTANIYVDNEPTASELGERTVQASMYNELPNKGARNSKGGEIAMWSNDYSISLEYLIEHKNGMMIENTDILLFTDLASAKAISHPAAANASAKWLDKPGVSIVIEVPPKCNTAYYSNLGGSVIALEATVSPAQTDLGTAYVSTYCNTSASAITKQYPIRELLENTGISDVRLYESIIAAEREDRLVRTDVHLSRHKDKLEELKAEEEKEKTRIRNELSESREELENTRKSVLEQKKLIGAEKEKAVTEKRWTEAKSNTSITMKALEVGAAVVGIGYTLFSIVKAMFTTASVVAGIMTGGISTIIGVGVAGLAYVLL